MNSSSKRAAVSCSTRGIMRRDFWEIVTGRYISVMEHVNPEMTPERYDAELDAWWAGRKAGRREARDDD